MNYTEMIEVMPFLERLKIPKTLFTFEGEHRWPPEEEILKVFDWIQVKLDQKGQGKIDAEQLLALYRNGYSDALEKLNKNNFTVAVEGLERLQESYPKELTKDSITAKLKAIKSSKGYKAQVVSASKAYEKEKVLTIKYQQKISTDLQNPDKAKLLYWEKEIEKLGKLKDKGDLEMQKMVDRLTFKVFANFYSSTNFNTDASEEQKTYAKKVIAIVRQSSER